MKRILTMLAVVAMATTACSGEATEDTAVGDRPSETQAAQPSSDASGSSQVDACIAAIIEATEGIDLSAADAEARLDAAFGPGEPIECSFFEDGPESVGLTAEELYKALEDGLPPDLFGWIGAPSEDPFEETADEL